MSHRATDWAVRQKTGSSTRKAVLVALADRHNKDTGRCDPLVDKLAQDLEMNERTVRRALDTLVEDGLISRKRDRRADGSMGHYRYVLPLDAPPEPPGRESAGPPGRESAPTNKEPEVDLEPRPTTTVANAPSVVGQQVDGVSNGGPRVPATVDRRRVTVREAELALDILSSWNAATGQDLRGSSWLTKFIMRIREYPEATPTDHQAIIATALQDPWWRGPPTPSVVYGNDAQFERSVTSVRVRLKEGDADERFARLYAEGERRARGEA